MANKWMGTILGHELNNSSLIGQCLTCHPKMTENEKALQIRVQLSPCISLPYKLYNQEHGLTPPQNFLCLLIHQPGNDACD